MRALVSLVLTTLLTSVAPAAVSVQVYRFDEQTPLALADPNTPDVYRDIMVGTRLTLFVVSDTVVSTWSGGLRILWDDWDRGTVTARGYNADTFNYEGSVLPACGLGCGDLIDSPDSNGVKFTFSVDDPCAAGEWFVLDYHANALGACTVGVFGVESDGIPPELDPFTGEPPPAGKVWTQALSFHHVPSRDYNGDSTVDFVDFSLWATGRREIVEPDPNEAVAADPNAPAASEPRAAQAVDARELALFCTYWLEQTDVNTPAFDPNVSETPH